MSLALVTVGQTKEDATRLGAILAMVWQEVAGGRTPRVRRSEHEWCEYKYTSSGCAKGGRHADTGSSFFCVPLDEVMLFASQGLTLRQGKNKL